MRPRVLSIEDILNRQVLDDPPPPRPRPCTALQLLHSSINRQHPPTSLVPLSPSPTPSNAHQASHLQVVRASSPVATSPVATLDTRDATRNALTLYLSDLDKSVAASPVRHSYVEVITTRPARGRPSVRLPVTDLWRSLVQSRADAPVHLLRRSADASTQLPRVQRSNERWDVRRPTSNNELPKRPPTAATLTARLKLLSRSSAARRAAKSYVDNDE